jgi:hypothetical protein
MKKPTKSATRRPPARRVERRRTVTSTHTQDPDPRSHPHSQDKPDPEQKPKSATVEEEEEKDDELVEEEPDTGNPGPQIVNGRQVIFPNDLLNAGPVAPSPAKAARDKKRDEEAKAAAAKQREEEGVSKKK